MYNLLVCRAALHAKHSVVSFKEHSQHIDFNYEFYGMFVRLNVRRVRGAVPGTTSQLGAFMACVWIVYMKMYVSACVELKWLLVFTLCLSLARDEVTGQGCNSTLISCTTQTDAVTRH